MVKGEQENGKIKFGFSGGTKSQTIQQKIDTQKWLNSLIKNNPESFLMWDIRASQRDILKLPNLKKEELGFKH